MPAAPTNVSTKHLRYLDRLRESGETNMFGATPYLMEEFGLSKADAHKILSHWMHTFNARQDENHQ